MDYFHWVYFLKEGAFVLKKNEMDEMVSIMDKENMALNVLLNRIEILNRIIEEQEKNFSSSEYLQSILKSESSDMEEFQKLEKENQKLKDNEKSFNKNISDLKEQLQNSIEAKNSTKRKLDEIVEQKGRIEREKIQLKEQLEKKEKEFSLVDEVYSVYQKYVTLDSEIKENFKGIIFDESCGIFAASVATEEKLSRIYEKIKGIVMQGQNLIIEENQFPEIYYDLAYIFEFYYKNVSCIEKSLNIERLSLNVGEDYDNDLCVRIGTADGRIEEILLQGYKVNDEIRRSIVLIKE